MGFKFWSRKRRYSYGGEATPPVTRGVSAQPPLREKGSSHLAAPPPSRRASTLAPVSAPLAPPKEVRRRRSMFSFGRKSHADADRDRLTSPSTGTGGRHRPRSNPPSAFERALPSAVDAPPVPPLPSTLPSRKTGTGAGAGAEAPFLQASDFDVPIAVIDAEMPSPSAAPKGTPISAMYQSSSPLLASDSRMPGKAVPSPSPSPAPSSKALPSPSVKDLPPSPAPSSTFPSATSAGPSSSTAPSQRSSRASATPTPTQNSRPRIPSAFRDPRDPKPQRQSTSPMLDVTAIDIDAAPDVLVDMPDNHNHLPIPTICPAPPSRKGSGSVAASVPRTSARVTNKVGTKPTAPVTPTPASSASGASAAAAATDGARDGDRRSVYEAKRLSKRLSGALPTLPPDARTPTGPSTPHADTASPSSRTPSASSSKAQSLRSLKKDLPDLPVQAPQPAVRDVTESPVTISAGTSKQMGKHAQSTPPPSSFPGVFVPALPAPSSSSPTPAPVSGDRVEPSTPIAAASKAPISSLPATTLPASNDATDQPTDQPSPASLSDGAPAQSAPKTPASWAWDEMECVVIDAYTPEATPKSKSTHQAGAFDDAPVDRPESPSPPSRSVPTIKRSPATEALPDVNSLDSLTDAIDATKKGVPGKALLTEAAIGKPSSRAAVGNPVLTEDAVDKPLSNASIADGDGVAAAPSPPTVPIDTVPIVVIGAEPPTPTPEAAAPTEVQTTSSPLAVEGSESATVSPIPDATKTSPVDVPATAALAQPEVDVVDTNTTEPLTQGRADAGTVDTEVEAPKVEQLDAEVSTAAPKTTEPKADALAAEVSKAEELKEETPAAKESKTEEPVTETPKAEEPVAEPKADIPVTASSDAAPERAPAAVATATIIAEPVTETTEPADDTVAPTVSQSAGKPNGVESTVPPVVDSKPDDESAVVADRKPDILTGEVSQPPHATPAANGTVSSTSPKGKAKETADNAGRAVYMNKWAPSSPPKATPYRPARSATEPSPLPRDKEEVLATGSTSVSPSSTLSSFTSGPDTTITTPLSIHTGSRHEPDSPTKTMRTTSPPTSPRSFSSSLSTSPRSPRRYSPNPPKRPLPEENPAAVAKEKLSPARLRPVGSTPRRHSHSTPPANTNANGEPSLDEFMLLFRQVGKRDGSTSIRAAVARAEGRMLAAHKGEGQ